MNLNPHVLKEYHPVYFDILTIQFDMIQQNF